ncbi:MAG: alanine--tRNA ligase [Chthoniobacterales bacterium]
MTSAEIRQSFLDFFREKLHTIVPSSSLLPDAPNLLFTNAGMNQFVPIFLGQQRASYDPPRAADTQKCIRAGGKHNDLDDVGLDTYHHTFFEMLGNWSFGDYFKKEAIEWAWELVVSRWGLPPERLYATVYRPGPNEPSEFDQEAHDHWKTLFENVGLNPAVHIVDGNKQDNFWMMGDTGPCGPCSELHVDLTPAGDTGGSLVNAGDACCIEIWNLVFIQFNANPDGTFAPLPARHVDTGMGFERAVSIIQGTKNFTDFSGIISNYETDVFRPIFDEIEKLSGRSYHSTLPGNPGSAAVQAAGEGVPPPRTSENSPQSQSATKVSDQEKIDIAFRVIADHIRTLSFAIADGIQPSNEGRGYVLRRILRRAVRYGRTLGFHEPFFYQLVDVLVRTMSEVFPELRKQQSKVKETIQREEESFNRTLDKGLALFETEVARLQTQSPPGSAAVPAAGEGVPPSRTSAPGAAYAKRRLPHFELPWAIYALTITTAHRRPLSPAARTIVLDAFRHFHNDRYDLLAVSVLPDYVHALLRPRPKGDDEKGEPIFWSLGELMQPIKSFSAHAINKAEGKSGAVWDTERFDRYVRSDRDLEEKFQYILRNPWDAKIVAPNEVYPWVWTPEDEVGSGEESSSRRDAATSTRDARATQASGASRISGEFAFRLYDEQGFPLDLTELMARERGLTVDVAGFEKLMEDQRARGRSAQKKEVVAVSDLGTNEPTNFLGYEHDHTGADVLAVVEVGEKHGVILNNSVLYAEMGGQVADRGEMIGQSGSWKISDTRKSGDTWIHLIEGETAPAVGEHVTLRFERTRRSAIERHHTVTHLLHWALHEVVSREATQKGSYVGPEKLTFDFASAALTKPQVRAVEKLVNDKIAENAPVSWTEIPYAEAKERADIIQFFGDKYGDLVRVVQIGGAPNELQGYSMELCGGTHARTTGEIGSFRILSEGAIAAGIRRIEAVAGNAVREWARAEAARQDEKFQALTKKNPGLAVLPELDSTESTALLASIDARAAQLEKLENEVRETEKANAKAAEGESQKRAAAIAKDLASATDGQGACVASVPDADGKLLGAIVDALKPIFEGPIFLAGEKEGRVALIASVPKALTTRFQAGKLIQEIAPLVGGKGGGRPELAQGGGTDATQIDAALAKAKTLLA